MLPCGLQAGSARAAQDGTQEGGSSRPRTAEGFSTEHPIDKYIRVLESMVSYGAPWWMAVCQTYWQDDKYELIGSGDAGCSDWGEAGLSRSSV